MKRNVKFYLGIDPGTTGAIACLNRDGTVQEILRIKKSTLTDIFSFMVKYSDSVAFIEKVHAMPGDGVRKMGAQSAFTFGKVYGILSMSLIAAKIPYEEITPSNWQKMLGITFKSKNKKEKISYPERKKILRGHAERLFPNVKMTNDVADALLIAYACARKGL